MKNRLLRLFTVAVISLFFSINCVANTNDSLFTDAKKKIMFEALAGVTVTKSMRQEFWKGIPVANLKKSLPDYMSDMKKLIDFTFLSQRAFWKSALVSYDTHSIYISPNLQYYRSMFRQKKLPVNIADNKIVNNEFIKNMHLENVMSDEDEILFAVSTHSCMDLPSKLTGSTIRMCPTRAYITAIIEQLAYRMKNFKKLFQI